MKKFGFVFRVCLAILCYIAIELCFRIKWLCQNVTAMYQGYSSHAARIQHLLNKDYNRRVYYDKITEMAWGQKFYK